MKQALFLIIVSFVTIAMQAQHNPYDSLWKKVDDLSGKKGLTKSALAEVDKIYALAKKEKQDAQLIKALVYKMQLDEQVNEEPQKGSITLLGKEISTAAEPAKSILNSLLARQYWNYFLQHRYQLYDRTQTTDFQNDDFTTWSIADFHARIGTLYLASARNRKLLQQTSLQAYDPVIVKGNVRSLRPTLFDLLAHEALEYFESNERDVTRPAYTFELKDEALFADAATYAKLSIVTPDSLSLHQKALELYQELLSFHAGDARPDALIDADLSRIQFVHRYAVMENKDALYAAALQRLADKWGEAPAAAQAWYLLASHYAERAGTYEPLKDTTHRYEYLKAVQICERVQQQPAESEGKTNCFNLLRQIQHREINLAIELVNLPGQPFRTLVQYRNFTSLYCRIIPLSEELRNQTQDRYSDAYWSKLKAIKPIRSWSQPLPATGDYQKHSAEIRIDALPVGGYMLLTSVTENFSYDNNPVAAGNFYVSNISYVSRNNDYFLLHRETGQPLAKATVQVWYEQYDYTSRRNKLTKGENSTSNENGFLRLNGQKNKQGNIQLEISYRDDHFFSESNQYIIYHNESPEEADAKAYEKYYTRVFFFTDRSIYRPGQTVYFKGIVVTRDFATRRSKIHPSHTARVILYNANGEKVDSLQLTTNEYGSYAGKFALPENVLAGEFRMEAITTDAATQFSEGETLFSVEEYKRPKFYVEYDTIREAYKVNDLITLTGTAKAYAGNLITGAQVRYRVRRQSRFIYPWLYRGWFPRGNDMEITHGVATTDDQGRFTIRFKAIPDLTIGKQLAPVFDYRITADVTDLNGETRSGEKTVPVSYKSLQINISLPVVNEIMPADSLRRVQVTTQNINGEFQPAQVRLTIHRLQPEERLVRKRYWQQPDQHVMSREEFIRSFPYDEYETESDYHTWNRGEKVWETTATTVAGKPLEISGTSFTPGSYILEAVTQDKYGEEVKDVRFMQLYDEKSNTLPSATYLWNTQKHQAIEPGETSTILLGSAATNLFVIQQADSSRHLITDGEESEQPTRYQFFTLNREKKSIDFTAKETDRGGFGVYHFFVKNNRFYAASHTIAVPWTNKTLSISYETFRDKTQPGSEEKWKLKISGYKQEKVAAEMLASLYDASLDQFKPHSWNLPDVWPSYYSPTGWLTEGSFRSVQSWEKYYNLPYKSYAKNYDRLVAPAILTSRGRLMSMAPGGMAKQRNATGYETMDAVAPPQMEEAKFTPPAIVKDEEVAGGRVLDSIVKIDAGKDEAAQQTASSIQPRKNFNETAFFFPDLHTDDHGNIEFSFTLPEALTRWKFQAVAQTKDLAFGYSTKDIVTQKQLMVQPNAPRFLREGDHIELSTKIVNMTAREITGTVHLELLDAATGKPLDGWFQNMTANQYFTVEAGKSVPAAFTVQVPHQFNSALVYRFTASAAIDKETVGDGEEASLPVLKNSMLVTESVALPMRGSAVKNFRFNKLLQSGNSETLQHLALTVEYTGNPVWYAVQSLPYLAEYPYECAEQTFNRFYANALASKIANASPRLKAIVDKWKAAATPQDAAALLSNLQKNQELKSVLLEETPWVLQAKTEEQQKKNIALLFDMNRMGRELQATLAKLQQFQLPNGGFPWFRGDNRDDRYITQYILTGIGHLKQLGAWPKQNEDQLGALMQPAIQYLDQRIREDYDRILKSKLTAGSNLSYIAIQYLYMRSFFPEYGIPGESFNAVNYFRKLSQQQWLQQSRYMQGMIALSLNRTGDVKTAQDIIKSLQQNAITSEELGMYWKEVQPGYYWHQAPVETQSLLIEAFSEIGKNEQVIADLTTWLLKQKQTQNWRTTKATADACYALLIGSYAPGQKSSAPESLNSEPVVEIRLGDKSVKSTDQPAQAGTGYFKKTFEAPFIKASMGDISVKIQHTGNAKPLPSWGAVYWQYFENLDKITSSTTALQLSKKLFVETNTDRGPQLQLVGEGTVLHPGTKIKVRIELRADRDLEYVHMKDMRASCMEPVNVLSAYKWQGGLGYYESTRDASTNFFFSWLPKGTYVFEYPLFVTHTGNFSNGITTIQCMYAPEFMSHSEGVRVNVE